MAPNCTLLCWRTRAAFASTAAVSCRPLRLHIPAPQAHDGNPMTEIPQEPVLTAHVDGAELTLLGTAHVSRSSAEKVRELLEGARRRLRRRRGGAVPEPLQRHHAAGRVERHGPVRRDPRKACLHGGGEPGPVGLSAASGGPVRHRARCRAAHGHPPGRGSRAAGAADRPRGGRDAAPCGAEPGLVETAQSVLRHSWPACSRANRSPRTRSSA